MWATYPTHRINLMHSVFALNVNLCFPCIVHMYRELKVFLELKVIKEELVLKEGREREGVKE